MIQVCPGVSTEMISIQAFNCRLSLPSRLPISDNRLCDYAVRKCVIVFALAQLGYSGALDFMNSDLNNGDHTGLYIHGEASLVDDIDVSTTSESLSVTTYEKTNRVNLGFGYSLSPRLMAHINVDFFDASRKPIHVLFIGSIGPGVTWYTPLVNTFFTGNVYYSILNAEGGDPTFGNRWRLGFGKEFLFFKSYGIGMLISYERGQWDTKFPSSPKWELSGVSLNLSLTYN